MNSWLGRFALWKCFPPFLSFKQLSTVPAFGMIDTALVGLKFVNRDIRAQAICMRSYGEFGVFLHELRSIYGPFLKRWLEFVPACLGNYASLAINHRPPPPPPSRPPSLLYPRQK